MSDPHFDIVIVGAGLAGVGTACRIAQEFPGKSMALLERRGSLGGTWDLFRYPGIRSDSDMYSYGYALRPWQSPIVLGDGSTIRNYIADAAREFGVDGKIHCGVKIVSADWSSANQRWTLRAVNEGSGESSCYSCRFLIACTGYYDQDAGFRPSFPGEARFKGLRIHPQQWPAHLDYAGKKVVVIGSGATAITLIPAMADKAAHITMLQRSPSYVVSLPGVYALSAMLGRLLPKPLVYRFARKRFTWLQRGFYLACKRWPKLMRSIVLSQVRRHVGKDFDMKHFTPHYMPWDQRVCVVPDADLFETLKSGKASVVTDHIETFTESGIRLKSGQELDVDIIITATGLNIQMLGGLALSVDGVPKHLHNQMTYKGVLVQDVPNLGCIFGYANAPWTLKVELAATYLCRLLKHMDANGRGVATPHDVDDCRSDESILGSLSSGYVQRGDTMLPRQGLRYPWRVMHHLGQDTAMLLKHPIEDAWLRFSTAVEVAQAESS